VLGSTSELDAFASRIAGCLAAMISALRGDVTDPSGLQELREGEDPQNRAAALTTQAHLAAARGDLTEVLTHARGVMDLVPTLGVRVEFVRWAWPLAVRTAHTLGDRSAEDEFVAAIDAHPIGHLPPSVRAERELLMARRHADSGDDGAGPAFESAIADLRRAGNPHNVAHGLLDYAAYLIRTGSTAEAMPLLDEAREIGTRLGAQPVLDRVDDLAGSAAGAAVAPVGESGVVAER
jgi:hypothetical protein